MKPTDRPLIFDSSQFGALGNGYGIYHQRATDDRYEPSASAGIGFCCRDDAEIDDVGLLAKRAMETVAKINAYDRIVATGEAVAMWLSAALDDVGVCETAKCEYRAFLSALPMSKAEGEGATSDEPV